ncbi:MAG TPA: hypothetical protein VFK13_00345 [Gemmatimonadaceae bacterium]|nr:hypothetical protein [Gemmatimonadaceae bacterium]
MSALLTERERYEGWLGALESRRASTPEHIYARVHADYTGRLHRVLEHLTTHREAIDEMLGRLLERLTTLDAEERKLRDERAEAELRAAVGEWPEERRHEIEERSERALSAITEERGSLTGEVERLRSVLHSLGGVEPPRAAPVEGSTGGHAVPSRAATASPERRDRAAAGRESTAFDELEFLHSVVPPRSGSAPARGASEPGTGEHRVRDGGVATSRAAAPNGEAAVASQRSAATRTDENQGDAPPPSDTDAAAAGGEMRESIPSFLKDVPPEQVKTLKCQECGTLNYPTEWYCERCGAELAAL